MGISETPIFRPLRRAEYDQLVELGAFQNERIELLDGLLVPMSPIGPPHCSSVQKLSELLLPPLLGRATVWVQSPFAAHELSEPEPDLVVTPLGDYETVHPSEALLVIEVAESSLRQDRGLKRRLYATCGVPEYWIVNLVDRRVEVNTDPRGDTYGVCRAYAPGESIQLLSFPDLSIAVSDVIR
jgi:Uma2 family endonuclease